VAKWRRRSEKQRIEENMRLSSKKREGEGGGVLRHGVRAVLDIKLPRHITRVDGVNGATLKYLRNQTRRLARRSASQRRLRNCSRLLRNCWHNVRFVADAHSISVAHGASLGSAAISNRR